MALIRPYRKYIILFVLLAFGYSWWHLGRQEKELPPKIVEVETLKLKGIQHTETFIGTIQAKRSTILAAKMRGILDIIAHAG